MPRSGFSSRLLLSAIQGGMLGAWWGLCIVATVRASEIGWGVVALDPAKGRDVFRWDLIVHQVSTRAGLAFVHTAWDLIPLLAIAGALAGVLLSVGGHLLRVDREQLASRPLPELLRRRSHVAAWLAPGIGIALLACVPGLGQWLFLPTLAWGIAVPFLMLHDEVVAPPTEARAWRINWPGAKAVATSLAILFVAGVFDEVAGIVSELGPWPLAAIFQAGSLLVGLLAALLGTSVWLERSGPNELRASVRSLLGWRSLGAMLALQVRLAILAAWLVPPLLALVVSDVWIWPQLEELASTQHLATSANRFHFLRLFAENGPLLLFSMLAPVWTFAEGRLYRLLFPATPNPIALAGTASD